MNYQGIGDYESVNKAIKIELKATRDHLFESWNSKKTYYRKKYKGFGRVKMFIRWVFFKLQDYIWGNGESPIKLIRTGIALWLLISLFDTLFYRCPNSVSDYWHSFLLSPPIFMGLNKPSNYPDLYLTTITIIRYIGFALFTSIIIKRYNRR